ncbi:MAG: hypothetical protein GY847_19645 [Proteobacteria bacterium]|nr:hypothetical protein [Pseudomonadota bacterium]
MHWVFDEVFLRPEAKLVLEREGITGITFSHPVYHRSGKEMTTVFQMRIEETIQAGLVTKELNTVTCKENNEEWKFAGARKNVTGYPFCGRVKYHHPRRSPITFKKEAFGKLSDVVKSQEYFGSGAGAHRLIVVSRKFTEVIAKHKLRGMRLRPVKLI